MIDSVNGIAGASSESAGISTTASATHEPADTTASASAGTDISSEKISSNVIYEDKSLRKRGNVGRGAYIQWMNDLVKSKSRRVVPVVHLAIHQDMRHFERPDPWVSKIVDNFIDAQHH